ncbi:MAG TPA: nucleotide sugar dehydrogenase [Candidatus Omnitrophota bacterium]|nr:nucleotide sugar dehydrogenase [Candidatus Omnitrophota bacterium]
MSSLKKLNKFLAGLVAVTFFATNTLTPSPLAFASVEPANTSRFADFKIPSEYGKVVDFAPALISGNLLRDSSFHGRQKDDSRILIHIQEAHANYDAQNNIRNLLKYLAQNYGAKLIFLEGAGGKLQPERLNFFPDDPELQKAVTERLMKAGELTGAEAFLIEKSGDANVQPLASNVSRSEGWGVENVDAYRSNWELYRSVYQKRETADRFLEDFYLQWRKRASREFDKNLRDFILRYAEYGETKISLEAWIETLKSAAMAHLFLDVPAAEQQTPGKRGTIDGSVPSAGMKMPLDLTDVHAQVNWPALVRYFRLKEAGKRIDETKVEIEKAGFLNDISAGNGPFGDSRSPALKVTDEVEEIFRSAKIGNLPVHKTRFVFERLMDVLPENFSFDAYPNLRLYIQQIILTSEIDSRMLQSEMKELAKRILESLLKTDREKELVTELREYQLLKKLFHLELSRDEYEREVRRNLTPEKLARLSGAARGDKRPADGKTVMPAPNSALNVLFSEAIRFYDGAIDREEKMMENAGKILGSRGDKAAVLITGGFHTDGFRKQITESGHSYIGITPNIGSVTREEEENYLRALLGTRGEQVTEKAIIQRSSSNVLPGNIVAPLAGDPDFMRQTLGADYAGNRLTHIGNLIRGVISALRPATSETLWARLDRTLRDLLSPAEMAGARSEARGEDKKLKDQFEDQIQKHQKFIEQKINLFQRDPDVSKKYLRPNMETFQAGFFEIASFLRRSLRVIRDIEPQVKRVYEMTMDWLRSMPDNFWSREAAPGVAEKTAKSVGILAAALRHLDEYGSAITLLETFIRKTNIRNDVFLLSHLMLAHSSLATRYYAEKRTWDSRAEHLKSLEYFALFLPLAEINDSLVRMLWTVKGTTLPVVFAIGRKDPARAQAVMEALERVNAAILEVLASSPRLDASIKSSLYEIQIRITEYLTSEQKKKETTVSVQPQEHKKTETVVDLPAQQTSQPRIDKKIRWQQGEEERRKTGASRIQGGQRSFPGDEAAPKRRALEKVKEKLLGLLKAGSEEDRELGKPGLQEEITSLNKPLGQEAVEVLSDFLWRVDEMTTEEQVYQVIDDALARSARSETRLVSKEGQIIWPFQSVMHIAWEMAPFVKKGGLADVIGELPLAMKRKYPGIDINVIIPYHRDINLGGVVPVSAGTFQYESPEGIQSWEAFKIEHHGLTVFLLQRLSTGHQKFAPLFQKGYQTDNFYEGANFSKAAVEFMAQNNIRPDIIHPHDQTAAHVPVILRDTRDAFFMESAVFYTAHHFAGAYQGKEDLGRARSYLMGLGLSARLFSEGGPVVWGGKFNALRGASLYPDMVSTVSGHFAWEAANSDLSEGLQHVLKPRYVDTKTFLGITNAIDKVMWSSRKGAGIQFPFEASTMEVGKRANKEYLQVKYGLKRDANAPLLSFVSRYDPWVKGFDIVPAVVGELLNNYEELQVVFAGAGDKGVENALADLKKIYPDRVYVSPGFVDADTVRFILAGSDFVGMPSRIEPAGLVQQQGLLLGAVPIVTRVGGLEETVHDPFFTHGIGVQTGFKSNLTDHLAMTFSWACVRALEMFRANKNLLTRIRLDGLDSVSSWDDRVDEYFEAYTIALRNRQRFIHPGKARSEVRWDDSLWEGIHERNPNWQRMNAILSSLLVLRKQLKTESLPAAEVLETSFRFIQNQGLTVEKKAIQELLERLTRLGLIRMADSVVSLAVSPRVIAVKADDAFHIKSELEESLRQLMTGGDDSVRTLKELLFEYSRITSSWPLYPVESRWPVLRAVALLEQDQQTALVRFLNEHENDFGTDELADSILLMLNGRKSLEGWLPKYAPYLMGRTIYYDSPEMVLLAGGLGRVGQFHTASVSRLLDGHAELVLREPLYHFRLIQDPRHENLEMEEAIDYEKTPKPVRNLKHFTTFNVWVNGRQVEAKVLRGTTDEGLAVYLLDGGDYLTRYLYRYDRPEKKWPYYSEFVEFFTRSLVELTRILEEEKREKQGEKYKGSIMWLNDGQLGPAAAYKAMMDRFTPALRSVFVWMVTHTYRNRGSVDYGRMGFGTSVWHRLFKNDAYPNPSDSTSAGVRSADGASAVAAVHRHEVAPLDPDSTVVAITNGDRREISSSVFRKIFKNLFPGEDPEFITAEQIVSVKRAAKEKLEEEMQWGLNPDKIVISYSGRMVQEKAGRSRAFHTQNLRELVRLGAQVIIYGNVQSSIESREMFEELRRLSDELNGVGPGKLIVRTGWSIEDQRKLLAATDLQVQDSDRDRYRGTGAAEYTEADVSVNGGLQMGPAWLEGIIQKQGIVLDRTRPGSGNTIIPASDNVTPDAANDDPVAYMNAFRWVIDTFNNERIHLASYQAASVRLSRVLNSDLPAAEYLRQFDRGVRKKDALKELARRIAEAKKGPGFQAALDEALEKITRMDRNEAKEEFGANKLPAIMAAVTILKPELLDRIRLWNAREHEVLSALKNHPEMKDLFEKGMRRFHPIVMRDEELADEDRLAVSLSLGGRNLVMVMDLAFNNYSQEEGKTWGRIGEIESIVSDPGAHYRVFDWSLDPGEKVAYPSEHFGQKMMSDWMVGIPVRDRERDRNGLPQRGKSYQALSVSVVRSEARASQLDLPGLPLEMEALAERSVTFIDRDMSVETVAERIQNNQVIYLAPPLEVGYDYGKYEEQLIQMAVTKIGPALERVRRHEAGIRKPYERKVFILRGMVDPGTSKAVYDAIKWNAHPPKGDDYDFDLVFQPDFTFLDARTEKTEEPIVVFGVMGEDDGKDAAFQAATKTVLDRIFGQFYQGKKIQYMRIRSAEMSKEMLIIYLGAKLAHFDDVAELSRAYGADLSAAAFGAGLDKRIRTIFTNPSLGFGGRLFVYLHWIYAQRLYKAAAELEGQTHQKLNDRKMEIEQKIRSAVERLERGENITEIVKDLPPQLHLLFTIKTILKINKQNILDFLRSIERAYESMYGNGSLRGKKVTLLGVGYSSQSGQITASPALLLIERLIIDEGISEFVIADPDVKAAFMKWVEEKRGENPRFNAVKFEFTDNIYDAAKVSDLTIIPTDSNKALRDIDIKRLGDALQGRPVFDGMNIFGLRADGTYRYKLEDVRDAGINLVGVGRLPLGPELDAQTGYRLGDSVVVRDVAGYRQVLQERGGSVTAQQKSVTVIGGGYVGLVTAANLAGLGHRVRVVDIKAKQKEMDALNGPETAVPIYEPGLREMIIDGKAKGLITFSTDLEPAVQTASIVYLAVGTPAQDTGEVDLKYILQASGDIGDAIKKHGGAKTLVVKSTVTPDTFRKMDETLAAKGLKLGKDYALVSNPEFLREGQAIQDVTQPDRTVLGFYAAMSLEDRKRAEKEILELWYPLMLKKEHTILLTDTASSTIVKYLANSFLAISITLSNLFSSAAEADFADFMEVRMPFKADDRIGGNAFLNAGVGYGGSCFPKDVLALNFSSKDATGHVLPLIDIATGFNEYFKTAVVARTVESVARFPQAARPLEGKSVIMLGMAFKADTDDMREASSASVLHELLVRGATQVRLHDPILSLPNVPPREVILDHFLDTLYKIFRDGEEFQKAYQQHKALLIARGEPVDGEEKNYFKRTYFPEKFIKTGRVVFEPDLGKLGKADIVFLVTEWRQYKGLDLSRFKQTDRKLWVVDGRNLFYDRRDEISQFAEYRGIGTAFFGPRSEAREAFAEVGRMITTKKLRLPKWVGDYSKATRNRVFATPEERMSVAVELSRLNVENGTGGPFGAVVFDRKSGKIFSMGVNLVVPENASFAHAEMVALTLAQERLKNFSLDHDGREFELVTSSQPCAMCFGAIPWSGVKGVVVGARGEDVETITGFDEGPIHPEWDKELLRRGIDVTRDILRDEAIEVLHAYVRKEGTIYNGKAESEKSVRSETRVYSGLEFQQIPEMNYEEFLAWYETQSKASRTAMENLTVEIMQGIAPLLANRFKVIEDMAGKFILNSESMRLLREKIEADRFEVARKILGVKTVEGYDALVLTKELALDRKGLFAIQKVFGGMPVIILADESGLSDLDRDFISRIPEASRPVFLSAALLKNPGDLSEAVRKSLRRKSSGRMMSLKAMAGTTDAMATLLKRQLKDEVVILTTSMFENFLSVAGVGGLVEQMQAEYLAIVRSA